MKVELCDLQAVWRECWSDLTLAHQPKRVQLKEAIDAGGAGCPVDRFRLSQVFRNIFENAIGAVGTDGEITVRCCSAQLDGRPALRLSFLDDGPGLTDEQRARIFDPFFTTKAKGTGLGMAIAKRIVQSHGGLIEAGDQAGPGAEIVLTLPRGIK